MGENRVITSFDIFRAKILIVDDQKANVDMLEQILREAGYLAITSTAVSSEVFELHRKNRYDLILLDLQMPVMDGFQVMRELKVIEADGYIPVLVITAQPGQKLRALAAGAKDFISKPFDMGEVLIRVHNMLDIRLLHLKNKKLFDQLVVDEALLQAEVSERRQIEEELNVSQAQLSVHAENLEGLRGTCGRPGNSAAANKRLTTSVGLVRKANNEHQILYLQSEIHAAKAPPADEGDHHRAGGRAVKADQPRTPRRGRAIAGRAQHRARGDRESRADEPEEENSLYAASG